MDTQLNRFNWISPGYDLLTKLIFGRHLQNAQLYYLKEIPQKSNVLVIGGGTGWLLRELVRINPTCRIWYIEASASMIVAARKKISDAQQKQIFYIHGTEDSIPREIKYDVVITNFFLDLFSLSTLPSVILKIKTTLSLSGVWFVCDFVHQHKWWQKSLLSTMYLFFRLTCGIESRSLPSWEHSLKEAGLKEARSEFFYSSFIKSALFIRDKTIG
jgi:ubiquinone/menaquinone biosynthesis C-methylase UbiE